MTTHPNLNYWLAALHMPDIGLRTMQHWLEHFTDIEKLFKATTQEWQAAGIQEKYQQLLRHPNWEQVQKDLHWAESQDHSILCLEDEDYPPPLKEISDPPFVLYVKGNKAALQQTQLAIVGSRQATPTGLSNAEQFAYALAKAGLAITSGLALGIDAASHRGAIAARGITIGVMGTGLHHIYPSSHRKLAEEIIMHQGAVISEFPLETGPKAQHFPRRNRIIGGLSLGVLVVEAALKSGSLITARHALEQGREVYAIPGSIHLSQSRGCHYLIKQGAKLVETVADILEEMPKLTPPSSFPQNQSHSLLSVKEQQILAQIGYEMTSIDTIISRCGLTAAQVSSILLSLELKGHVHAVTGGYVKAVAIA